MRFVSGALRSTTRDLIAEAIVPNPERLLMPQVADVEVVTQSALASYRSAPCSSKTSIARVVVVAGRIEERIVALGPAWRARRDHAGVKDAERWWCPSSG